MPFMGDSRKPRAGGIWPLQHTDHDTGGAFGLGEPWPIDQRASILACRIIGRLDDIDNDEVGQWVYDGGTVGDVNLGFFWEPEDEPDGNVSPRSIGGWAFAWPVETVGDSRGVVGRDKCFTLDKEEYLPLRVNEILPDTGLLGLDPDKRYNIKENFFIPPDELGDRAWPKFPRGYHGIALTATNEEKQYELFRPTDPRLICVSDAEGDLGREIEYRMSTVVADLKRPYTIDTTRQAPLHTQWRVIKGVEDTATDGGDIFQRFPDRNVISRELGDEGLCNSAPSGFYSDKTLATNGAVTGTVIAKQHENRVIHCGADNSQDKHLIGEDADGNPINLLHSGTNTIFYRDSVRDAPLEFQTVPWPNVGILPLRSLVTLTYDGGNSHISGVGRRDGLWRWYAHTPFEPEHPLIRGGGSHAGGDHHGHFWDNRAGRKPELPKDFIDPSIIRVSNAGIENRPKRQREREERRNEAITVDPKFSFQQKKPTVLSRENGAHHKNDIEGRGQSGRTLLGTPMEMAGPSITFRPNRFADCDTDYRYWNTPDDDSLENRKKFTPATGRIESYGAQQGDVGACGASSWDYTEFPGTSRFEGGTATGGSVFLPPEVDLADLQEWYPPAGGDFTPSGKNFSTSFYLVEPRARFGAGIPDLLNGRMRHGYSWGVDEGNDGPLSDVLLFYTHQQTGPGGGPPGSAKTEEKEAIRFDSDQNIGWRSSTSFWGTLEHANTADRVFTFPDADCTVACEENTPQKWNYRLATGPTTITANKGDFILADASGGLVTVTVEETSATNDGFEIQIQRIDNTPANDVTVERSGTDQFFGLNPKGFGSGAKNDFDLRPNGECATIASDLTRKQWRLC